MKKIMVVCAGFLLVLGLSTASMADPFQNGSFEDGPQITGGFDTLSQGNTDITGWEVTSGSIDLIGTYWEASDGARSIDLNGNGPGAISQTFDTEPGKVYQVLFDMAGNPDDALKIKVLLASAGSRSITYEFNTENSDHTNMGWTEKSFMFQASGDSTTLEFAGLEPDSAWGPALDNVRVIAIGSYPLDTEPPTGAVHAYDNMLWPPNNKKVKVKIKGYVKDEMSAARDGDGVGVSRAYLMVNRRIIILRDENIDRLKPDGSFSVSVRLRAKKGALYRIQLYAADTAISDTGPNEGLVDQTRVYVPRNMSGKSKKK